MNAPVKSDLSVDPRRVKLTFQSERIKDVQMLVPLLEVSGLTAKVWTWSGVAALDLGTGKVAPLDPSAPALAFAASGEECERLCVAHGVARPAPVAEAQALDLESML